MNTDKLPNTEFRPHCAELRTGESTSLSPTSMISDFNELWCSIACFVATSNVEIATDSFYSTRITLIKFVLVMQNIFRTMASETLEVFVKPLELFKDFEDPNLQPFESQQATQAS